MCHLIHFSTQTTHSLQKTLMAIKKRSTTGWYWNKEIVSFHTWFPLTSDPRALLRCSGDSSGCRLVWAHSVMKDKVSALYRMWYSYSKVHIPAPNEHTGCIQADRSLSKRLLATCPTSILNPFWIGILLDSIQQCIDPDDE